MADTFYKWVRTVCHSLPPIFHTYSVWSGGVCPTGKINERGYHLETKWEEATFRDFIFDLIIAWNLPARLYFQRLKKNYGCLKWYFSWLHAELSPSLALTVVVVDLQSTMFTLFCFQILSPSPQQLILGCSRPAVQSVDLRLCFSSRLFPLVLPTALLLHHLKPFQFLLPTPLVRLNSFVPGKIYGQQGYSGDSEALDLDKCCRALLQASEACGSRWGAGLAKMQLSCDQLEQSCPLSLPPGMSLEGRSV